MNVFFRGMGLIFRGMRSIWGCWRLVVGGQHLVKIWEIAGA